MKSSSQRHIPQSRKELVAVLHGSGDTIKIDDAVSVLGLSRQDAAKKLSRWTRQGWLRRVGSGTYVAASLDLIENENVLDDPWILVPALFGTAYIGGRTAAEHWDLTEQIFNDIVVFTTRPVRKRSQKRHGVVFTLKHIPNEKIFGTCSLWRKSTKVQISDVHRTVIDMLDVPSLGGGIQQVADCVKSYLNRSDRSDELLLQYGDKLGNGAVFKRLGFLASKHPLGKALSKSCMSRLTRGNAKLDPDLKCQRLITKWRLFVPTRWNNEGDL